MHLQVHKIVSDFSQACLATISKRGLVYERGGSAARYFCLSRSSSGVIAFFLISYFFPSLLLVDSFYITKITILLFDHYIPFYTNLFLFYLFSQYIPFPEANSHSMGTGQTGVPRLRMLKQRALTLLHSGERREDPWRKHTARRLHARSAVVHKSVDARRMGKEREVGEKGWEGVRADLLYLIPVLNANTQTHAQQIDK